MAEEAVEEARSRREEGSGPAVDGGRKERTDLAAPARSSAQPQIAEPKSFEGFGKQSVFRLAKIRIALK